MVERVSRPLAEISSSERPCRNALDTPITYLSTELHSQKSVFSVLVVASSTHRKFVGH